MTGPEYPTYPGQDDQDQPVPAPPPPPPSSPPPPPPASGQPPPAYGQPPADGGAPPPQVPPQGTPRRTNQKAVWALVLGIIGMIICCLLAGIPAMILGRQAQREVDALPEEYDGRGMATAGFVLGIISTVASAIYIAFIVVLIATDGFGEGLS